RGEPAAAVRALRRAVSADPLWEGAQRSLMRALAQSGDYASAVQTYRDLRVLLHRELIAEPAPETSALFQTIRARAREQTRAPAAARGNGNGDQPAPPDEFQHLPFEETRSNNLPEPATPFIGREKQLAQVKEQIGGTRLLTLT